MTSKNLNGLNGRILIRIIPVSSHLFKIFLHHSKMRSLEASKKSFLIKVLEMEKITNQISSETNNNKDFLESLFRRLEPLPILSGQVDYSSKEKCFALDLILSEKNTISAIIYPDRLDYVSFVIYEDDDIRLANHLPLERFINAIEDYYEK